MVQLPVQHAGRPERKAPLQRPSHLGKARWVAQRGNPGLELAAH